MKDPKVFTAENRQEEMKGVQRAYGEQFPSEKDRARMAERKAAEDLLMRIEEEIRQFTNAMEKGTLEKEDKERIVAELWRLKFLFEETKGHYVDLQERQEADQVAPLRERGISLSECEREVGAMMKEVGNIDTAARMMEQEDALTDEGRQALLDQLRIYPERLLDLDNKFESAEYSQKRSALVEQMTQLRERLGNPWHVDVKRNLEMIQKGPKGPVEMHEQVKATYSSVQHLLTIDQRREMRTRIATLTALVQRAEDERLSRVKAAILAAVSHATEHAPALVHATGVCVSDQDRYPKEKARWRRLRPRSD